MESFANTTVTNANAFPCMPSSPSADPYERCRRASAAFSALCTVRPANLTTAYTVFQSSAVPKLSLAKYATYIAARCSHGEEAVLIGLVLMARYCRTVKQLPTAYTEHRLLLAAIVVGSKAHYDDFYKNVYMAHIGGVSKDELQRLEWAFISGLNGSCLARLAEVRDLLNPLCEYGRQLEQGVVLPQTVARHVMMTLGDAIRPASPLANDAEPVAAAASVPTAALPTTIPLGRFTSVHDVVTTERATAFEGAAGHSATAMPADTVAASPLDQSTSVADGGQHDASSLGGSLMTTARRSLLTPPRHNAGAAFPTAAVATAVAPAPSRAPQ